MILLDENVFIHTNSMEFFCQNHTATFINIHKKTLQKRLFDIKSLGELRLSFQSPRPCSPATFESDSSVKKY